MEDDDVKYVCDIEPGSYEKGKKIVFSAEHIADNDNRMDVYANSTLLKPDAQGNYSTVLPNGQHHHTLRSRRTHLSAPTNRPGPSPTTAVLSVCLPMPSMCSPACPSLSVSTRSQLPTMHSGTVVLTTDDGRIKEFISPIGNWSARPRQGSEDECKLLCQRRYCARRQSHPVWPHPSTRGLGLLSAAKNDNVIASLPALNNQTPVYNFTFSEGLESKANMSGVVSTAVHGRDLTFKDYTQAGIAYD